MKVLYKFLKSFLMILKIFPNTGSIGFQQDLKTSICKDINKVIMRIERKHGKKIL